MAAVEMVKNVQTLYPKPESNTEDAQYYQVTLAPYDLRINDASTKKRATINITVLLSQPLNKTEEEYLSDRKLTNWKNDWI